MRTRMVSFPHIKKGDMRSVPRTVTFYGLLHRSGPIRLNSSPSFLSGISADSHAASLTVGSITA